MKDGEKKWFTWKHTVTLYERDRQQLVDRTAWLGDAVLEAYLALAEHRSEPTRVRALSPVATMLLRYGDDEDVRAVVHAAAVASPPSSSSFGDSDPGSVLLMPISDASDPNRAGGSHWSLLLLVLGGGRPLAVHLDSIAGANRAAAEALRPALARLTGDAQLAVRHARETPRQANGYDCGVHVAWNADQVRRMATSSGVGALAVAPLPLSAPPADFRSTMLSVLDDAAAL